MLVFESRGPEVGATIHHPHGQIYAYPFVPPAPRREAEVARRRRDATSSPTRWPARSRTDGASCTTEATGSAFVPFASSLPVRGAPRPAARGRSTRSAGRRGSSRSGRGTRRRAGSLRPVVGRRPSRGFDLPVPHVDPPGARARRRRLPPPLPPGPAPARAGRGAVPRRGRGRLGDASRTRWHPRTRPPRCAMPDVP